MLTFTIVAVATIKDIINQVQTSEENPIGFSEHKINQLLLQLIVRRWL